MLILPDVVKYGDTREVLLTIGKILFELSGRSSSHSTKISFSLLLAKSEKCWTWRLVVKLDLQLKNSTFSVSIKRNGVYFNVEVNHQHLKNIFIFKCIIFLTQNTPESGWSRFVAGLSPFDLDLFDFDPNFLYRSNLDSYNLGPYDFDPFDSNLFSSCMFSKSDLHYHHSKKTSQWLP
jgi:hypothetical protein